MTGFTTKLHQLETDLEEKGTWPGVRASMGVVKMFVLADTSVLCGPTGMGRGIGLVDVIFLGILN